MPKTLYLVRHAKSAWPKDFNSDFHRPLNARGNRDAPRVARHLATLGCSPDIIISSAAARARTTAEIMASVLGYAEQIRLLDELYFEGINGIINALADLPDDVEQALLVSHNPTISDYGSQMTSRPVSMPTCAVAVIEGDWPNWPSFAAAGGSLKDLILPRELPDQES